MAIELATHADLPQLVDIYNQTIASRQVTADLSPVSVASREAWFAAHQQPNRPIYVMRNQVDGDIVAWGSFSDYYARAAYDGTAEISVYVHQQYRGMGLGRRLVALMLENAAKVGIVNVIAVIFAHNVPSVQLFESFGFSQWGRLPEVCDMETMLADVLILGKKIV